MEPSSPSPLQSLQGNDGSRFPNAVVASSAIPQDNVEILHAKSVGVPIYKRDYWLAKLTEKYNLIAVSGSHGKSTTASMLAYVLKAMGDDLTAIVGAHVPQFPDGSIFYGGGKNFVLEADEYDGCFLGLSPSVAVVTNLDWEHVDIFEDEDAVKSIFRRFLKQIRVGGHLVICGDSQCARSLLDQIKQDTGLKYSGGVVSNQSSDLWGQGHDYKIITYGFSSFNDWYAESVCPNVQGGSDYILCERGRPLAQISLQIPGVHNVLNSLAVIATVLTLIGDKRQSHESIACLKLPLSKFMGVSRRFDLIGTIYGCHIYDDFAHHPTEVRAVLQAARQRFPNKALIAVFQPHTYRYLPQDFFLAVSFPVILSYCLRLNLDNFLSRLVVLKDDFANALSEADQVVVSAVYAARETNDWNINGKDLAASIIGPPSEYIPCLGNVVDKLALQILRDPHPEIVILTLGAGDVTTVGPKLLHELQTRSQDARH
ncbi:UDP-N-acetylmuramate--L-alanine ligase [Citrus sinensis]|nr:UDP-N-acetylmuramate--L-alanine ligase [Citrus sinensis]